MEVLTILAADYANIAEGGKVNVMGIFRAIKALQFPARHASMHLVVKLGAELGEYGQTRQLTVLLVDQDGIELMRLNGNFQVPSPTTGSLPPEVNAIFELRDIKFLRPGRHEFIVLVDKDRKAHLPIDVVDVSK